MFIIIHFLSGTAKLLFLQDRARVVNEDKQNDEEKPSECVIMKRGSIMTEKTNKRTNILF